MKEHQSQLGARQMTVDFQNYETLTLTRLILSSLRLTLIIFLAFSFPLIFQQNYRWAAHHRYYRSGHCVKKRGNRYVRELMPAYWNLHTVQKTEPTWLGGWAPGNTHTFTHTRLKYSIFLLSIRFVIPVSVALLK